MKRWRMILLGLATAAMLACAASSFACTVCFGDSDDPILKGAQASVLFLGGVTYMILGGGVASFFLLRRRARRLAEQNAATAECSGPSPGGRVPLAPPAGDRQKLNFAFEARRQGAFRQ